MMYTTTDPTHKLTSVGWVGLVSARDGLGISQPHKVGLG